MLNPVACELFFKLQIYLRHRMEYTENLLENLQIRQDLIDSIFSNN